MNLENINFENIPPKTKWLGALAIYCLIVANIVVSLCKDTHLFTWQQGDDGMPHFQCVNGFFWLVLIVNYVAIIHLIARAFNNHPRAITFWVCLAGVAIVPLYTLLGLCVLAYMLYPLVKSWVSAKFVQAVKSATAADSGAMPPHE
jgi:Na+/proline symporter